MNKKIFSEQELLEGLDAYTAHADELAEVVETDIELNEAESN